MSTAPAHRAACIGVCLKWVSFDPSHHDDRFAGISPADQAALELALRHGAATGLPVRAVAVGPPAAGGALRDALAAGARSAVLVRCATGIPATATAHALAGQLADAGTIWCGDASLDRGSGSVPAFLADLLRVAQVLGVVAVEPSATPMTAMRRLDGGRREQVGIDGPCVISVEGSATRLRRASLRACLAAASAPLTVVDGPLDAVSAEPPLVPYRPRPKVVAPPAGADPLQRVTALVHAAGATRRGDPVALAPDAAADRIVAALRAWGYVAPGEA